VPGAPYVTALRNGGAVQLAWSTSNTGGSPVTQYTISRGTSSGNLTFLANVPGTQTRFIDSTATDTNATYFYRVAATNVTGTSCGNNEVSARFVGNSAVGDGYTVLFDPNETGPPTANADLDIERLSIAEPSTGPHANKLVINLKVRSLALVPNERMWRIIWDSPNAPAGKYYVGMTKDAAGAVSFEYGTVFVDDTAIAVGIPTTTPIGAPDAGAFTTAGLITIVVSKDKIGNMRTGDLLGNFEVRTYNVDSEVIRTNNAIDQATGTGGDKTATANDLTANAATYSITGTIPGLNSVVSRKAHGTAGAFDVDLALAGPVSTEPRSGGATGDHTLVFNFAGPSVVVNGTPQATVSSGAGTVTGVNVVGTSVLVNISGVPNAQITTVTLNNVSYGVGTGNVSASFGALRGDTNNDRTVNAGDATQTRTRSGNLTDDGNFRNDVNRDGVVNSGDAFIVRNASGTSVTTTAAEADAAKEDSR
jgi:hypothetical protein